MKTRFFLFSLFFFLASFNTPELIALQKSGEPSGVKPLSFGHVTEALLDSLFSAYDQPETPGCAVGVAHDGEILFSKGYGTSNLDYGVPLHPNSRFMIASVSKQFAAAALLMMEQEGYLDLDEDLRIHIPELKKINQPLTARQMMHHTSGLRDIYNLLSLADIGLDDTTSDEDALALISRQTGLNFKPGTRYLYSNTGYFLISVLTWRLTGKTLREYSEKHFFEPLGMMHTHWHDDATMIVPDRVISYLPTSRGPGFFYRGNMERVGARGLFTTVEDFLKWDASFNYNQTNLDNFYKKMTQPGYTTRRDSINYASGLRHGRYRSLETIGHGGSYMGFRTHHMRFPKYDFTAIAFCNMSNISPAQYTRKLSDLYLKDVFIEIFSEYTGTYFHPVLETGFQVILKDGELFLTRDDDPDRQLSWFNGDRFRADQWEITFKRNKDDLIDRFTLEAPRTGKITFNKQ